MGELPGDDHQWDVFISYASEDRQSLVKPLVDLLAGMGVSAWWDQFELKVGDSLIEKITLGLSRSRYGIVVISRNFLAKRWPQVELESLTARDIVGDKVILSIRYDIPYDEILRANAMLARKKFIDLDRPFDRHDLVDASLQLRNHSGPGCVILRRVGA